jgi:transcriptional regulator with XRE-family HTH domain
MAANSIYFIESGRRPTPSSESIEKIARGLKVDVAELYSDRPVSEISEGKVLAPSSFEATLAEGERRELLLQYPVVRELEDLKQFALNERLDDWEMISRGEGLFFNIDHGYVIDQVGVATGYKDWLETLWLRVQEERLPPHLLAWVHREVVALIERIGSLVSELQSRADEAAGITSETPEQERLDRITTRSYVLQNVRLLPEDREKLAQLPKQVEELQKSTVA